ncbi:SURF1-like protein [Candidatus Methylobacter favarea]|uniref:SURF1-like protein n=1 Tax=Candidatus Methylobacter favarea TaxID=2707345 RepID=A0A8S0XHE2_9GAMM|nr:SURF1 family protein [Candidatus Methylobacter favarea]CAA9891771.1 SURF1-like protein [Candidatus Methylobacter favarea]
MKFQLVPTVAYLCLLPLLIALGIWQLGRSEEKREFLELEQRQAASEVLHLSPVSEDNPETLRYRKVEVKGHYDNAHQFLIDNQVSEGKPGYFVMTPLVLEGADKAVLVNRGWIPLNRDRSVLPNVEVKKLQATITGRINSFPRVGIKLAGAGIPTSTWPSVVQVVDSNILARKLGYPLFQFQVELDKHLPNGFKREWRTTTLMLPEQHIAYAIQWFALALTLTIIFIWYSFKKKDG